MRITAQRSRLGIALVLAGLLAGAGLYFIQYNSFGPIAPVAVTPQIDRTQTVNPVTPIERQVSIYWIESTDRKFKVVPKAVQSQTSEQAVEQALNTLFNTPTQESGLYSAIPIGAKLLNFSANDRDIFVNVSREFTQGGGSAGMTGRAIQVLYTATSLNPDGNLFLMVEGAPISTLGGEGLEIKQPMTRKDFPLEF